jgi:hypothetical protein
LELTDSSVGKFTLNQSTNETINIGIKDSGVTTAKIADKAVTTAKIADHAVGAHHTKACADYAGNSDAEVWVFYCGSSTVLVDNTGLV